MLCRTSAGVYMSQNGIPHGRYQEGTVSTEGLFTTFQSTRPKEKQDIRT